MGGRESNTQQNLYEAWLLTLPKALELLPRLIYMCLKLAVHLAPFFFNEFDKVTYVDNT